MPFDTVAETLLKGGIAPRHVRRYIGELCDHLEDGIAQQKAAGFDDEDARIRARALLGDDRELTAAMLEQTRFRSWPARLPWLVFLILPPVLTAVIGLALYSAFHSIGYGAARINALLPLPESGLVGFSTTASGLSSSSSPVSDTL